MITTPLSPFSLKSSVRLAPFLNTVVELTLVIFESSLCEYSITSL